MKTRFVYPPKSTDNSKLSQTGFTIVELLVVIVVIAILAAITIVAYTGISQKAIASALQSDLDNASRQLKLYYVDNGSYPTSLSSNCPVPADTRYCLKPSPGNTFTYTNLLGTSFKLIDTNTNSSTSYYITDNTSPNNKNLLYLMTGDSASFEGGTVGGWTNLGVNTFDVSTDQSWNGTHSGKMIAAGGGQATVTNYVTTIASAGTQYTLSVRFMGVAGKSYGTSVYDDVSGEQLGTRVIATGGWDVLNQTFTFGVGSTNRRICIRGNWNTLPAAGDTIYWDAIQLESGSVATPF